MPERFFRYGRNGLQHLAKRKGSYDDLTGDQRNLAVTSAFLKFLLKTLCLTVLSIFLKPIPYARPIFQHS
jgi:hypothetical protein